MKLEITIQVGICYEYSILNSDSHGFSCCWQSITARYDFPHLSKKYNTAMLLKIMKLYNAESVVFCFRQIPSA